MDSFNGCHVIFLLTETTFNFQVSDAFKSKIMRKVERMLHHITHHERDIAQSGFSVYTGVAGVAMLLFFASKRLNREDLLVVKHIIS